MTFLHLKIIDFQVSILFGWESWNSDQPTSKGKNLPLHLTRKVPHVSGEDNHKWLFGINLIFLQPLMKNNKKIKLQM